MVDYIADYLENIRDRRVLPDKKPGFLKDQIPANAPIEGEAWLKIFNDVEKIIMPGVTHWQSPHMHAYFPALNSFPSMLGDMLSDAINSIGFTWVINNKNKLIIINNSFIWIKLFLIYNICQASSPVQTELEMLVMNWLGKMIGLPEEFLHSKNGVGGGVIQVSF